MKTISWKQLLAVLAFSLIIVRADEEQNLIVVLQSNASAADKGAACARLRVVGTPACVSALSRMLREEQTSHAARYALEGLSFPEALSALREAFGQTSGLVQAGIVDSLGWKQDAGSVPLLTPLLTSADVTLAGAAARSLGRIGGKEAIGALRSVAANAPGDLHVLAQQALLRIAEEMLNANDQVGATTLFRELFKEYATRSIRSAAWRGWVMSADSAARSDLVLAAITGTDRDLEQTALTTLSQLTDAQLIDHCLAKWKELTPAVQVSVLRTRVRLGGEVLPAVLTATESLDSSVRIAAWQALGALNAPSAIPVLARAAVRGETAEKEAARAALNQMHGSGARDGFVQALGAAPVEEKSELIRALGERGEAQTADLLLPYASAEQPEPVRLAALESLRQVAAPETLSTLLTLALHTPAGPQREPAMKALEAVCRSSKDKEQATRATLSALQGASPEARQDLLPLMPELGTSGALQVAVAAIADPDPDVVKEALRALARWPNAAPAQKLLELAGTHHSATVQVLALRACIEVAAQEPDNSKRLAILQETLNTARRPEEKKQALAQISGIPTVEALGLVQREIASPAVSEEAALAAITISEKLAATHPELAQETARQVLSHSSQPEIQKRAWALRGKPVEGPFIQDWVVAGPYSKPGANGALAAFEVTFPPETSSESVPWKEVERADQINLAGSFPGRESCAAYLKTEILSPEDHDAVLLLGSDDGVKAWLNSAVVHSHNVDRGDIADQDMAPIHLRKGTNELILKITQGGAGWSAHARIVGLDGRPLEVRTRRPETVQR